MFGISKKLKAGAQYQGALLHFLLEKVDPSEILKIVFTPENIQAAAYGFGKGLAEGAKE